jgi:hypothetical protein
MTLGGPACAWGYQEWQEYKAREAKRIAEAAAQQQIAGGFTPTFDFQYSAADAPILVNGKWKFPPTSRHYGTTPR